MKTIYAMVLVVSIGLARIVYIERKRVRWYLDTTLLGMVLSRFHHGGFLGDHIDM